MRSEPDTNSWTVKVGKQGDEKTFTISYDHPGVENPPKVRIEELDFGEVDPNQQLFEFVSQPEWPEEYECCGIIFTLTVRPVNLVHLPPEVEPGRTYRAPIRAHNQYERSDGTWEPLNWDDIAYVQITIDWAEGPYIKIDKLSGSAEEGGNQIEFETAKIGRMGLPSYWPPPRRRSIKNFGDQSFTLRDIIENEPFIAFTSPLLPVTLPAEDPNFMIDVTVSFVPTHAWFYENIPLNLDPSPPEGDKDIICTGNSIIRTIDWRGLVIIIMAIAITATIALLLIGPVPPP